MEGRNDSNRIRTESCGKEVVTCALRRCQRASDRCGSGLRQGSVWKADTGRTRVKQQWSRVKKKMKVIWALNRATSQRSGQRHDVRGNVATFQRGKFSNVGTLRPTSRRSRE